MAIGLSLAACSNENRLAPPYGRLPINGVVIYLPLYHVIEVGDTTSITSGGFHDGNGANTENPRTIDWGSSDSSTVQFEARSWYVPPIMPQVRIRGLKPGKVMLTSTLNGVSATDSLRVIPVIQSITLTPRVTTVRVGDTVTVEVRITAADGSLITAPQWPVLGFDPLGIVYSELRNRLIATAPGTVTVTSKVRRATGTTTITVLPRTP